MSISWSDLRSVLLVFGPFLLPKAISMLLSLRNSVRPTNNAAPRRRRATSSSSSPSSRQSLLPASVFRAIIFLSFLAILLLVKAHPHFEPENIFVTTESRLQIPTDVLFTRLKDHRPEGKLTPHDERLRARLVNLDSRLLYFQFGPETLGDCPFCKSDDPDTFFYYALPRLLTSHVVNAIGLGFGTSYLAARSYGPQWRSKATYAAIAVAAIDMYLTYTYEYYENASATRLSEIDTFHWTSRSTRLITLACLDLSLALLLYLSASGRAFVRQPSPAARLESANKALGSVRSKLAALGIVRNAAARDGDLRDRSAAYWAHEVRLVGAAMEEREVVDEVNEAIREGRIQMEKITKDAEDYADSVFVATTAAEDEWEDED